MIITQDIYDGSFIHSRFAYTYFRDRVKATGDIVAFRAPAKVETEFMIDREDVMRKDFIYSEDMLHFCFELPLTNLFGGVAFQRLFCSIIGDILSRTLDVPVEVEGDDIFVRKEFCQRGEIQQRGKASVSIVCENGGAILGHVAINIVAGSQAPSFAYSTYMKDDEALQFMQTVIQEFYSLTQDIYVATAKIIN